MKNKIITSAFFLGAALLLGFAIKNDALAQGNFDGMFSQGNRQGNMPSEGGKNGMPGNRGGRGGEMGGKSLKLSDESVAACDGKSEKDACSFTATKPGVDSSSSDETIAVSGTCMKDPIQKENSDTDTAKLACFPEKKDKEDNRIGENANSSDNESERVEKMKELREEKIYRIESRTGKIIEFFESKDVDADTISTIRSNLETFKSKADILFEKYDTYIALLKDEGGSVDDGLFQ